MGSNATSAKPGTKMASINAKRLKMSPGKIRERYQAGEDVTDERAIVRLGTMGTRILTGQEDLSVWSDEELLRGQRKDKNGRWQGRKPVVVPKALHDELVRRTLAEANELMRNDLVGAVKVLTTIIHGVDVEAKDKLKAIEMVMNRVMGKEPVRLDVDVQVNQFDETLESVLLDRGDVMDVESWDAEDDPDSDG